MGNAAVARGAIEGGVQGVLSYPGTPSTEISEIFSHIYNFQHNPARIVEYPELTVSNIYFEYSINEKVALEKAIAFSIGGRAAMSVMKNVGMNVACDALMSITYQTINAPLVIVICDDPGCHSSSNEQDSRFWGPMASVPVLNPSSPQQALEMSRYAFQLSAELKLPVIVRTTTRVSHSRGVCCYSSIKPYAGETGFQRVPENINVPARTATAHTKLLNKLTDDAINRAHQKFSVQISGNRHKDKIIVTSGVATAYVTEYLMNADLINEVPVYEIGIIFPIPDAILLKVLQASPVEILVLEELEPMLENTIRLLVQRLNIRTAVYGKGYETLNPTGEFDIEMMNKVLSSFCNQPQKEYTPLDGINQWMSKVTPRPPVLCAGCPHRATFYLLKLLIPRDQPELILCGDIGCFGLGALPPLRMMDTVNHMGMSVAMAQGLNEAIRNSGSEQKTVAMLGDGTFFHSGLVSLVNAVYTRANITVIIFDNRTIGMTGHQSHPGAAQTQRYNELEIEPVLKGMGIEVVETFSPYNMKEALPKLERALTHQGVSVVVAKAPCIFLPDYKDKIDRGMSIAVDGEKCNTCANHCDLALACSRIYSPRNNLSRAKSLLMADIPLPGYEQLCPANICNHGFFAAIREGNYASAVDIVRDKMLFARTCGDICHRPCELYSGQEEVVPIKALKKLVTENHENFRDFSKPVDRVAKAGLKDKKVAIAGAGPAGLSAAYDLVQQGYDVTIFEKEGIPGGMIMHAIPTFRMDKEGFVYEAMQLEEMGVTFRLNTAIGTDITVETLTETYDAVLLSTGTGICKKLPVAESLSDDRHQDALFVLKAYNWNERIYPDNATILVIGGGNSAVDAARAAQRMGINIQVTICCRETRENMPAFAEEIAHASAEGINLLTGFEITSAGSGKQCVHAAELISYPDGIPAGSIEFDYLISAVGLEADKNILGQNAFGKADATGRLKPEPGKIFVAGDLRNGNHMSVIGAIASGKKAAIEIRAFLEQYNYPYEGEEALHRLNTTKPAFSSRPEGLTQSVEELRTHLDLHQSCAKCNHCIDNFGCPAMIKINGKVQIDMSRCNLCGLCIDVCPNGAIHWVTEEAAV
jgi:indolepyruvate ferredoxin oxidoreductase alpha subunit